MPYKDRQLAKSHCREYHREWYKNNAKKRRDEIKKRKEELLNWLWEYKKTLSCKDCKENHPACLDFHHRDATQKDRAVSKMIRNGCSKEKILQEIDKCDVLCANCHRKLHYLEYME